MSTCCGSITPKWIASRTKRLFVYPYESKFTLQGYDRAAYLFGDLTPVCLAVLMLTKSHPPHDCEWLNRHSPSCMRLRRAVANRSWNAQRVSAHRCGTRSDTTPVRRDFGFRIAASARRAGSHVYFGAVSGDHVVFTPKIMRLRSFQSSGARRRAVSCSFF